MTLPHLPGAQNTSSSSDGADIASPECQQVLANVWDYLDGNCSSELAERIEAHVSVCESCLRFRQFQERFFTSLAGVRERLAAPARVHVRIRKALAAERR